MAQRNIVLIGFMGTGKTEVGMRLAERLKYRFVDTDRWIEERMGRTISEIFGTEGEAFFREVESGIVAEAAALTGVVISTGGGVVSRPENLRRLKAAGFLVCLRAEPETILQRISGETHRPLLQVPDPLQEIKRLLIIREEGYSSSDLTIDTTVLAVDRVVEKVLCHYLGSQSCQEAL